jgi:hypothetical protein
MPSAAIRRFRYDEKTATLYVTFVSGEAYAYDDVPPGLPRDFRAAFSKGRFFREQVRGRFPYRRLGREAAPPGSHTSDRASR